MRIRPGETYEDWAKRCQMYEHGHALQRIAQGDDVEQVLTDMSKRLMEKMLHPMYKMIQDSHVTKSVEDSKRNYEENYIKKYGPKADHVVDDLVETDQLHNAKNKSST